MRSAGATLVEPVELPGLKDLQDAEGLVLSYEFKAGINEYLASRGPAAPVHSLAELIEFNDRHAGQELAFFGQELFIKAEKRGGLDSKPYIDALRHSRWCTRERGIDGALDKDHLDALVMITAGPPGPIDLVYGDREVGGSSTLAAVAGYPSISVPLGYCQGVPFGISFVGRAFAEATLIRLAYAFEQATLIRKPPRFRPSADLPA
jgi:amidase